VRILMRALTRRIQGQQDHACETWQPNPQQDQPPPLGMLSGKLFEDIGHLTKKNASHLANIEIPQMADVSGGFLLYTGFG